MLVFTPGTPVYLPSPEVMTIVNPIVPFVQRSDLIEVLHDYFSSDLDEPSLPEMICQDLSEWHPNGLWCYTDSQQLNRIIANLPPYQKQIIFNRFVSSKCAIDQLERQYVLGDFPGSFEAFLDQSLDEALSAISSALILDL